MFVDAEVTKYQTAFALLGDDRQLTADVAR
jgi:hypothetical protein